MPRCAGQFGGDRKNIMMYEVTKSPIQEVSHVLVTLNVGQFGGGRKKMTMYMVARSPILVR